MTLGLKHLNPNHIWNHSAPSKPRIVKPDHVLSSQRLPRDYYNPSMHDVVVYSRPGCHLCDVIKDTLRELDSRAEFHWHDVNIDTNPDLRRKYDEEIPVVFIDGRKAFKYRMTAEDFLRVLAARA